MLDNNTDPNRLHGMQLLLFVRRVCRFSRRSRGRGLNLETRFSPHVKIVYIFEHRSRSSVPNRVRLGLSHSILDLRSSPKRCSLAQDSRQFVFVSKPIDTDQ